jgi:hypothetical protein
MIRPYAAASEKSHLTRRIGEDFADDSDATAGAVTSICSSSAFLCGKVDDVGSEQKKHCVDACSDFASPVIAMSKAFIQTYRAW